MAVKRAECASGLRGQRNVIARGIVGYWVYWASAGLAGAVPGSRASVGDIHDETYGYTRDDLQQLRNQAHTYRAFSSALDHWDQVSAVAFRAHSVSSMRRQMGALLGLDDIQQHRELENEIASTTKMLDG